MILSLGAVIAAFSIEEFLAPNDMFNIIIYFFAGMVFGADRGMYSLLMYMITSKVIDIVEIGGNSTFSTVSEVSEIIGEHIKTYGDLQ